jgi:hypothetical protein
MLVRLEHRVLFFDQDPSIAVWEVAHQTFQYRKRGVIARRDAEICCELAFRIGLSKGSGETLVESRFEALYGTNNGDMRDVVFFQCRETDCLCGLGRMVAESVGDVSMCGNCIQALTSGVGVSCSPTYNWTKPSVQTHHTMTNQTRHTRAMVVCDMKTCSEAGGGAGCMRFTSCCGVDAGRLDFFVVDVARTWRKVDESDVDRRQGTQLGPPVLNPHADFKARRYAKQGK